MKRQPLAVANAAAVTVVLVYVICAGAVILAPELAVNVMKSWFHGIDISKIAAWNITFNSFFLGLITAVAYAWGIGFVFTLFYNFFSKK